MPLEEIIDSAIAMGDYSVQPIAKLTPFIEQMGRGRRGEYKKEFWWEREWRHRGNFRITARPIIICPASERAEITAALQGVAGMVTREAAFIDPNWSLEQIIGNLAGLPLDDLGAF